jgi:hypothetical protein
MIVLESVTAADADLLPFKTRIVFLRSEKTTQQTYLVSERRTRGS